MAVRARIVGDNGAYASVGGKVLERAAGHACGPYRVPNVDVEATAVYTNNPPSGAMRGFGANQAAFAMEGVLDMLAEQVGLDGWEIRWRNALDVGDRCTTGQRMGRGGRGPRDAARRAGRLPRRAVRRDRLRHQERRRRQRAAGARPGRPAARGGRHAHAVPLLDRDGPGRPHGVPPARGGGAGHRRRTGSGSSWTRPTSSTRARPPPRGRRCSAAGPSCAACEALLAASATGRSPARGPRRPRVRRRVPRGLDHEARRGGRRAGHPLRLRLGDPGRHPRRRGPNRARRGRPRRGQGAQPGPAAGPGRGRRPHGPRHGADRGVPGRGRRARHRDAQVAGHHPGRRRCRRSRRSSSRCPQPEGPLGAKGMGEAVLVPTAAAVAGALHAYDGIRRTSLPMSDSPAARALLPRLAREAAGQAAARARPARPGRAALMSAVTPGLVCAHHHLYSALARGMPAPPRVATQLRGDPRAGLVAPGHGPRPRDDPLVGHARGARGARERDHRDHRPPRVPNAIEGSLDVIAEACAEVGVRSVLAYGITDRHGPDGARRGLAENERFIRAGGRGLVGSTPPSPAPTRPCAPRPTSPQSWGWASTSTSARASAMSMRRTGSPA